MVKGLLTVLIIIVGIFVLQSYVFAAIDCSPGTEFAGVCLPEKPGGAPEFSSLTDLIMSIINIAVMLVGLISVLFVVIGGYKYVTASGNDEQIKAAKGTIANALIGLVLVLLAFAVVRIVANLIAGSI